MIYLQAPGGRFRVVVLATAEVDRIKGAAPILSPDKSLMIAWTPDPEWLLERIRTGAGSSNDIALAIDQAARRPEAGMLLGADGSPLPSGPEAEPADGCTVPTGHLRNAYGSCQWCKKQLAGAPGPRLAEADALIKLLVAAIRPSEMNKAVRDGVAHWLLASGIGSP